jgi:hypothetical protein
MDGFEIFNIFSMLLFVCQPFKMNRIPFFFSHSGIPKARNDDFFCLTYIILICHWESNPIFMAWKLVAHLPYLEL